MYRSMQGHEDKIYVCIEQEGEQSGVYTDFNFVFRAQDLVVS